MHIPFLSWDAFFPAMSISCQLDKNKSWQKMSAIFLWNHQILPYLGCTVTQMHFFFYLGAMKFCLGDSRVISSWSKVLVMCFRFLHMWQFLFHSWRGVDFVHLKCFRYFEGSRIRFFSDCEQFEESRPCLPGLWQAYAFSLLCNSDNFPIMIFQPSLFVCLFLIMDGWGCSEWYRFLFKIRMDIFGLTQHVLSWRLTSSEPFNFVFKTLTEVK